MPRTEQVAILTAGCKLGTPEARRRDRVRHGPAPYGRTIGINHIVSLEFGASDDSPTSTRNPAPAPRATTSRTGSKTRLHNTICARTITLRAGSLATGPCSTRPLTASLRSSVAFLAADREATLIGLGLRSNQSGSR